MIFKENAPAYWDRGFSVIPADGKRPKLKNWPSYLDNGISDETKREWLSQRDDRNLFLLLGGPLPEGNKLLGIDIDDDKLIRSVSGLLGSNLIAKRGKRGINIFVSASPEIGSTKINCSGDLEHVDILAKGKGTVIPPSIHPDTGEPYTWVGASLLDSKQTSLPVLDTRLFRVLKTALESEHLPQIITGRTTNETALRLVGQLVKSGATDDEIRSFIFGALPENYQGNTRSEISTMIKGAREKGFDEEEKSESQKQSEIALEALSDLSLFKTETGEAFAEFRLLEGALISEKIKSQTVQEYIEFKYYTAEGKPISAQGLNEVKSVLRAKAKFTGPTKDVYVRKAVMDDSIYIDLGRKDGKHVKISVGGWEIITDPVVNFRRPSGFGELPLPILGGSYEKMHKLFGLGGPNSVLRLAFELACFIPYGPNFLLMTQGSQGSGKTKQNESIKKVVDPSAAPKLRLPRSEHVLAIQASEAFLLSYDNASALKWEMSDALCTVITGGGLIKRELYTDDGTKIFKYQSPVMLNGIGEYADRPDLLERALQLNLPRIPKTGRKSERLIDQKFEALLPEYLGFLYACVAMGLANLSETPESETIRMADAMRWLNALEPATGLPEGTFTTVIESAQLKSKIERIESNVFCMELYRLLRTRNGRFEGRVGELFDELTDIYGRTAVGMPKTPSGLSKMLARYEPMLEVIGIFFEFHEKNRDGRPIEIRIDEDQADFLPTISKRSQDRLS